MADSMQSVTPLVSDVDIYAAVESVLHDDAVVNVWDVHALMVMLRDQYEVERRVATRGRNTMAAKQETQELAPLFNNPDLGRLVRAIRDETSRDTAYELLIRVRGTYERERAETWRPVNPIAMANDEYADADIMLCYRPKRPNGGQ